MNENQPVKHLMANYMRDCDLYFFLSFFYLHFLKETGGNSFAFYFSLVQVFEMENAREILTVESFERSSFRENIIFQNFSTVFQMPIADYHLGKSYDSKFPIFNVFVC